MAFLIDTALRALTYLGKHGAAGFAISIFVGLALPDLASTLRPFLPVTIFCFVTLSFARADFSGVARVVRQPARLATATAWATLAMPVAITGVLAVIGRGSIDPGLLLGIALIAASPPLMGVPAYASLLGLDNSMAIALLVLTTAMTPFIAPPLASFVAGEAVPLDPFVLGLRLFGLLAGALVACLALRRFVGTAALTGWRHPLDGVNVIIRLGGAESFVLGLGTGMRNTGLLVSAMGAACPPNTYLFFALLQFPIYTAPLLVGPLARLILRRMPA